jgi:hypothetical protein
MTKTRSKAGTSAAKPPPKTSTASRYTLPEEMALPPQLFVLPKTTTPSSRVVTLQNPRYSKPARYLVCPETGIYEFTKIAAPSSTPRSWLIESAREGKLVDGEDGKKVDEFEAHVTRDADIFVATPIDPLFLVLPTLAATSSKTETPKRMFLTSDDHFDSLAESAGSHLSQILKMGKTRTLLEGRMAVICDTVEAGDETMFRLNEDKLMDEILAKARRMGEKLPKSMEERFVAKPLEAPVVMKRSQPTLPNDSTSAAATPATEKSESQASISSVETVESAVSQASTAPTSVDLAEEQISAAMTASDEVLKLQRLRVAFNFICSAYISSSFVSSLKTRLSAHKSVDFAPLEEYLVQLAKLKAEVMATRAATENTRKRGLEEEDDDRAEKRRKKEEEEKKKKAGMSRGVRDLKKVNTSGMKKLSEFFKKK